MRKEHGILAALVVAAAVWAYGVAHPLGGAPSGAPGSPVWDVPVQDVTALSFHDGTTQVRLEAKAQPGADEPAVWVDSEAPGPQPHPPPAHTMPAPGRKSPPKRARPVTPEQVRFRGNATALQLLKSYAKLTAERDLGPLAALDAKSFGLPSKAASLELQRQGGAPLRLELGRSTFGDAGRYAHNPQNDHLYLLRSRELKQFITARSALVDRRLLGLRGEQAQRIELVAGGAARTFHHLATPGQWGTSPEASDPTPAMTSLVAQLDGLRVLRYRTRSETAPTGPAALEVRLFRGEGKEPDAWLRVFLPASGTNASAVSSFTQEPVEISRPLVQQVLQKARGLLHST